MLEITFGPLLPWVPGAKPPRRGRWNLLSAYTAASQCATSKSTSWSCAVTRLWLWAFFFFFCLFLIVCWGQCNLKQESPTVCPHWTITRSNGLKSCCARKASLKCLQKLQPSPVLTNMGFKQVQCRWIQYNKSSSFTVWGIDVHWAAVSVA